MITRQYQTYYGIHLDHHEEIWAGNNYNKILVKEYLNADVSTSDSTDATSITFLLPQMYMYKYYLDGVTRGWFTIYNQSTTDDATLDSYTVTLLKTEDVPNAEVTLGSKTMSLSSNNSIPTTSFLKIPVFITLDKQVVEAGNKLLLKLEISTTGGDVVFYHANDSSNEDVKIKIPYAPTG